MFVRCGRCTVNGKEWFRMSDKSVSLTDRIYKYISLAAWGIAAVSILRLASALKGLPDEIGVHFLSSSELSEGMTFFQKYTLIFNGHQPYDVYGNKLWLIYPYGVTLGVLICCMIAVRLVSKIKKTGLEEKQRDKFMAAVKLALGAEQLIFSLYFCVAWVEYVVRQLPMRYLFTILYIECAIGGFLFLLAYALILKGESDKEKKAAKAENT